ncbi:2'-5' RNA ligase family protein [Actinomadura rubrisoli]|uniref:2'-5' RNA ligase family protein n=1 Tax=Actinomadura rubrisoli TaxID=2530368 RepID=A0A4R5B5N1_9ACTN|nr:2'-5' RNA ligase family protein [Actinomadura rubrisoli]TDD79920.1 2'-5' RNA ligase family protein [Actinomadura rubrisoli]
MTSAPESMRDHWWWRPGWKVGRRMYTWHITFDGQAELHQLVHEYQARLAGLPGLDPIPEQWLHLTTQGLGFADEVPDEVVVQVVGKVRSRLADVPPVEVSVGPAIVDPEVVRLKVHPAAALVPIRTAIRDAIIEATGSVGESPDWNPHVSVAYSNVEGPLAEIAAVLAEELPPVQTAIKDVQLILLGRDEQCYTWDTKAVVPLTG